MEINKKYFEKIRLQIEQPFNNIEPDLKELAAHFYPRSIRFLVDETNKTNKKKNKTIIDSTPLIAVRNFASGLMSGATNPATNWFKLRIKNYDMQEDTEVKNWCYTVEKLMRDVLNSSKIYQKLPVVYKQLGVFAFSALAFESDYDNVFTCKVLPIGSYRYAKNYKGEIDTFFRTYQETAKNIVENFGEENCSQSVKDSLKTNPNNYYTIIHAVLPNPNYNPQKVWAKNKKFISAYYELNGQESKLLSESGFDKFPYVVFEAEVNGEDIYPCDCPAINALPDVKQLFNMVKEEAKAVKKIVSPQYRGPAMYKNQKITSNPDMFLADDESGNGVRPVHEVDPRILEIERKIQEIKEMIKEHFYNDLFAMILNTAERGRTATEVNELKEEKMVLLSPLLLQIHAGLSQIIDWILEEFIRVDILPEPPEQIQGGEIDIEFVSTLAQAQKVQKIAGIERFTTFTINLANSLDPILRNKINGAKIIDDYADFANIDPAQLMPNEYLDELRQQQAEKQAQMEQMQQLQQGTEMIKNMGGVDAIGNNLAERVGL